MGTEVAMITYRQWRENWIEMSALRAAEHEIHRLRDALKNQKAMFEKEMEDGYKEAFELLAQMRKDAEVRNGTVGRQ